MWVRGKFDPLGGGGVLTEAGRGSVFPEIFLCCVESHYKQMALRTICVSLSD